MFDHRPPFRPRPALLSTALSLTVLLLVGAARPSWACTAFRLSSGRGGGAHGVVAKSYDWGFGHGMLLLNPRGVAKQALPTRPGSRPARWVSRYTSVTFNQFGRELPQGGMNEAGLVIEVLWLGQSRYPAPDARPTVNELQWIQAQLDRHATVAEMIAGLDEMRVERVHGLVHYLACDRSGQCAAFEHLDGQLKVAPGARVLTNHSHAASTASLDRQRTRWSVGFDSHSRFARATRLVRAAGEASAGGDGGGLVASAFAALDQVRWFHTQWQIVYDPELGRVHYRTRGMRTTGQVDLRRLQASCGPRILALDLETPAGVNAASGSTVDMTSRFVPYDGEANRRLVARSARSMGGRIPAAAMQALAQYPDSLRCAVPAVAARSSSPSPSPSASPEPQAWREAKPRLTR